MFGDETFCYCINVTAYFSNQELWCRKVLYDKNYIKNTPLGFLQRSVISNFFLFLILLRASGLKDNCLPGIHRFVQCVLLKSKQLSSFPFVDFDESCEWKCSFSSRKLFSILEDRTETLYKVVFESEKLGKEKERVVEKVCEKQ